MIGGKYRVERVIGQGGMARVVAARHVDLEELVAIKILLPDRARNDDVRERFASEARAAAKIKSEHVARVTDVGETADGTPYMVMEYLDGEDLAATLARRGKLPVSEAMHYILQACDALREAHSLGIVHRDVKPANLFLAKTRGRPPSLKVLDFGISKIERHDRRRTETKEILGSPWYMSPEQLKRATAADARSDVWSVGVILYETVTGEVPFDGESMTEVIVKVLQEPPSMTHVPDELVPILRRCLAKNPDDRYASMDELAAAVRALLDEPSTHRPAFAAAEDAPATMRDASPPSTERDVRPRPGTAAARSVAPRVPGRTPAVRTDDPPPSEAAATPRILSTPPHGARPTPVPPKGAEPPSRERVELVRLEDVELIDDGSASASSRTAAAAAVAGVSTVAAVEDIDDVDDEDDAEVVDESELLPSQPPGPVALAHDVEATPIAPAAAKIETTPTAPLVREPARSSRPSAKPGAKASETPPPPSAKPEAQRTEKPPASSARPVTNATEESAAKAGETPPTKPDEKPPAPKASDTSERKPSRTRDEPKAADAVAGPAAAGRRRPFPIALLVVAVPLVVYGATKIAGTDATTQPAAQTTTHATTHPTTPPTPVAVAPTPENDANASAASEDERPRILAPSAPSRPTTAALAASAPASAPASATSPSPSPRAAAADPVAAAAATRDPAAKPKAAEPKPADPKAAEPAPAAAKPEHQAPPAGEEDDQTVAFRVSRRYYADLKSACWDPTSSTAVVTVTTSVSASGAVTSATAMTTDPKLGQCVESQVRTWTFPTSTRATRTLQIPIRFRR